METKTRNTNPQFTRAEVSRMSDLDERMLRYYEGKNLINPAKNNSYGKQGVIYNYEDCMAAIAISNFRKAGMNLHDIKFLLSSAKNSKEIYEKQIELLEEKKAELEYQEGRLKMMYIYAKYNKYLKSNKHLNDIYSLIVKKKWVPTNLWPSLDPDDPKTEDVFLSFFGFADACINPDNHKKYTEDEGRKIINDMFSLIKECIPYSGQTSSFARLEMMLTLLFYIDDYCDGDFNPEEHEQELSELLNEIDSLIDN